MRKFYYLFAATLVCLPLACSKVNEQEETPEQVSTVTYIQANGNEDETKGSVDGSTAAFTWNADDKIAVWASGYKISDALADTYNGSSTATFSFSGDNVVTDGNRANFAIYPAALVWDGSAIRSGSASNYTSSSLRLTLPASYTLAEVQDEVSPTPMIAANASGKSLSFKALCPLLRITVENIPKQTKRIEFDFNGKKVQGEFTLTDIDMSDPENYPAIATSATGGTDDIITVTMADNKTWHDYLVVNLPVPAGTYGDITIIAYDADSDGHALLKVSKPIKSSGWTPTRKSSRKMTAALPAFFSYYYDAGYYCANGYYSFAPGNLQATTLDEGTTWNWSFAEHQYDYIGDASGNRLVTDNSPYISGSGTVDLFCWVGNSSKLSGNAAPYGITSSVIEADYGSIEDMFLKKDWGSLAIDDYDLNYWSTIPSELELYGFLGYKFVESGGGYAWEEDESHNRYRKNGKAVIFDGANNIRGFVLIPDVFYDPMVTTFKGTPNSKFNNGDNGTNGGPASSWGNSSTATNYYTLTDWVKMEAAGAVFLPAAGYRETMEGGYVSSAGEEGYYWINYGGSYDAIEATAWCLYLSGCSVYNDNSRSAGRSVRLVKKLD